MLLPPRAARARCHWVPAARASRAVHGEGRNLCRAFARLSRLAIVTISPGWTPWRSACNLRGNLPVASLKEAKLRELIAALLEGRAGGIGEAWRVKGIVLILGIGVALVQGVGDQIEVTPWPH